MEFLKKYTQPDFGKTDIEIARIKAESNKFYHIDSLKNIFGLIDLTSLNSTDTLAKITGMTQKVNKFKSSFSDMPDVAAICVYPALVPTVKEYLNVPGVNIASVAGGFPASQTFLDVKLVESSAAVLSGADEIDVVISIGTFLSGNYQTVFEEIKEIKNTIEAAHLKVILESGVLEDPQKIWDASIIAMEAGADFIKTSTGKMQPAATIEAVYIMSKAIKEFYRVNNKKIGLKPAGGISTGKQAVEYYAIVANILGKGWLNKNLFRFGASSLANNLLSEIAALNTGAEVKVSYF